MGSERTIEGVTGSLRVSLQAPLSFGGFFFYRVLPAGLRVWTETFSFFFTFFFFFLCRGESCGTGGILRLFLCVCVWRFDVASSFSSSSFFFFPVFFSFFVAFNFTSIWNREGRFPHESTTRSCRRRVSLGFCWAFFLLKKMIKTKKNRLSRLRKRSAGGIGRHPIPFDEKPTNTADIGACLFSFGHRLDRVFSDEFYWSAFTISATGNELTIASEVLQCLIFIDRLERWLHFFVRISNFFFQSWISLIFLVRATNFKKSYKNNGPHFCAVFLFYISLALLPFGIRFFSGFVVLFLKQISIFFQSWISLIFLVRATNFKKSNKNYEPNFCVSFFDISLALLPFGIRFFYDFFLRCQKRQTTREAGGMNIHGRECRSARRRFSCSRRVHLTATVWYSNRR